MIPTNMHRALQIAKGIRNRHGEQEAEKYLQEVERELTFENYKSAGIPEQELAQMFPERFQGGRSEEGSVPIPRDDWVQRGAMTPEGEFTWQNDTPTTRDQWQDPKMYQKSPSLEKALEESNRPPPIPETMRGDVTGSYYQQQAPAPDKDWTFVGNRSNFFGDWYPKGASLDDYRSKIGDTTYNNFKNQGYSEFNDKMHNANISPGAGYTDQDLSNYMQARGLSGEGDRNALMQRYVNANESSGSPLEMQLQNFEKYRENGDKLDGINLDPISDQSLQEGIELGKKKDFDMQWEDARKMRADQSNAIGGFRGQGPGLNPVEISTPPYQGSPPVNAWDGSEVANDGWGQKNIQSMKGAQNIGRGASNAMQIGNLQGSQNMARLPGPQAPVGNLARQGAGGLAAEGAAAGEMGAAAGGAGMLGSAAMMASRAVPIMNLVMLGGMLMKQMTAGKGEDRAKQQEIMYRT